MAPLLQENAFIAGQMRWYESDIIGETIEHGQVRVRVRLHESDRVVVFTLWTEQDTWFIVGHTFEGSHQVPPR